MEQVKIFEKAKELGDLIANSEIKKRADEANKALTADKDVVAMLGSYHEKREEKLAVFKDRQPTAEEAKEINEYLQEEFNKMAQNPVFKEYIEANQQLENVLNQMDMILKNAISGGHSCSGSCSECGGCH